MKLSTKIILPIILISALLILLAGCTGTGTVPDESPGYTPGTITGIIAAPCCSKSADQVSAPSGVSPEYWCYYCVKTWYLQNGVEVILTYGEDEIDTTTTDDKGVFTFTNVSPGKNYVVTAYCLDFDDDRPLVKDVALGLIEGDSFDTKITDLVSTSLGLVVDFLVVYTEWGPEDISLDEVLADRPNFPKFPKFKKLIIEVRRVLENCQNVNTDDDVQYALCLAAEEISGLNIGCGPGYTPGEGEGEDECEGNIPPSINSVELDGNPISINDTVNVVVGTPYVITVNATDDDGILGSLFYSATVDGTPVGTVVSNVVTVPPPVAGTFEVYVYVYDGCDDTPWGPVTVVVDCPELSSLTLDITVPDPLCQTDCATINSATVNYVGGATLLIEDLTELTWSYDDTEIDFTPGSGAVCLASGADPGTYTINATYEDDCGKTVSSLEVDNIPFVDCNDYITFFEVEGRNSNSGNCNGKAGKTYSVTSPVETSHSGDPDFPSSDVNWPGESWLFAEGHTPNVKYINFTARSNNSGTTISYSYRYKQEIDGTEEAEYCDWIFVETRTVDAANKEIQSECMEAPSDPSTTYCSKFEIRITANGINPKTYIIHIN